jgi:hypothetical protein
LAGLCLLVLVGGNVSDASWAGVRLGAGGAWLWEKP